MKTIIFKVEYSNKESIDYDSRVYSSIVRWALERYFENKDYKTVYNDAIKKFKINSYLLNCAVREAKGIYKEAPFNLEVRAEDVYDIADESKNDILMIQGIIDMYFENIKCVL